MSRRRTQPIQKRRDDAVSTKRLRRADLAASLPRPGTRVLRTRLREILAREGLSQIGFLAESVGVAENTLRTLLRDDWDQLARDTIERVCDRFQLDVADLFQLHPDSFWTPLLRTNKYVVIRGMRKSQGRVLPLDAAARSVVTKYLNGTFPGLIGTFIDDLDKPADIVECARNNNCIVVGSPRSNPATEVILSHMFGAEPFVDTLSNRCKVPFRFVFRNPSDAPSAVCEPWKSDSRSSGVGIYDGKATQFVVEIDWLPFEDYLRRTIHKGTDCAMVAVVNRPFNASKDVKLILLAGLSGIGTEAAALALTRDFRNLEPAPDKKYTLGVLEAYYKKTRPNEDNRILTGYRWKYLSGGRKTLQA